VQIIRCTKKLLNELDVAPGRSTTLEHAAGILGPWHANLTRIERRKCILFTNDKTLYSFLATGVKKKDLMKFRELFVMHLKVNLEREGFGPADITKTLEEYGEIAIGPTTDRSVLGSMNDLADQADFLVHRAGGLEKGNMLTVNMMLNRVPMGAIKYRHAIDKVYELFGRTDKIRLPVNPFDEVWH